MATKTLAAQVDEESDLYQEFEEYQKQFESKSEALRAALRAGLLDESKKDERPDGLGGLLYDAYHGLATWLAIALILLGFALNFAPPVSYLFGAAASLYALTVVFGCVEGLRGRFDPDPAEGSHRAALEVADE